MTELIALVLCAVVIWLVIRPRHPKADLGIAGTLVWMDKGKKTKPFLNEEFYVCGKLDLIYQQATTFLGVEYKHRDGQIYESDIVQAKVAALSTRATAYPITRLLIKTRTRERYIELTESDSELYSQVEHYVEMVRLAKTGGELNPRPSVGKCASCGLNASCQKKMVA